MKHDHNRPDFFFIFVLSLVGVSFAIKLAGVEFPLEALNRYLTSVDQLVRTMWWGILLALIMVSLMSLLPRDLVGQYLGSRPGIRGIARAALAGILFDLCSHGIVLIAMRLYKSGATVGQTMAFLVASPWNSFSLMFIMGSLFGWGWTLVFVGLSALIAITSGLAFDYFVDRGKLPPNPATPKSPAPSKPIRFKDIKDSIVNRPWSVNFVAQVLRDSWHDSKAILRWTFFGIILSSALKGLLEADNFAYVFGPSVVGLVLTILGAALIEVCSEGTIPIGADLMNIAQAPGNSFAFMMSGVSTDYTEIMAIREGTGSWKIALFLPLITVPQIFLLGYLLNQLG